MKAKELKALLSIVNDEAEVYTYADHGQMPEQCNNLSVATEGDLEYYGEDIEWEDDHDNAASAVAVMIG